MTQFNLIFLGVQNFLFRKVNEEDWYITTAHPMNKEHYISFVAFASDERIRIIKQYPEWDIELRIPKRGHGMLIWY